MHGVDASSGRTLPEPTGQLGNCCRRAGYDDLDAAVGEILDPAVEPQTRGLFRRRRTIVDALDAASDDAANRSSLVHASIVVVARARRTQRQHGAVLRAHGIHARGTVRLLLNLLLGFGQEAASIG
jgi:hypothetical protein